MTPTDSRWQPAPLPPQSHFDGFTDLDRLLLQVLYNRGITEREAVVAFLAHRSRHSADPYRLTGMEAAVARIARAIKESESIVVYGDYDADGVTATVLLTEALRAAGAARVRPYIPDRMEEGYGLHVDALEKLAAEGSQLVITVDCGIRAVDQVRHANRLGMEVIVTDHHTVGPELPPAAAVIDPKQAGDTYPDDMLAGVGVAFKLVQALIRAGLVLNRFAEEKVLDLVAVGTVADLSPLLDENRALVHRGLAVINEARRPGLAALLRQAGVRPGEVTATTIGYGLGPRINAAGRMAHADKAVQLLATEDPVEADNLAGELNGLNRRRRDLTREMTAVAEKLALADAQGAPLLFAARPEFPSGIVGLIASRLAESQYRPAIVAQVRGELTVGSCRSIPEFHITDALDQCHKLLEKHGGHAAAAGFTVQTERLPALRERLTAIASEQLRDRELIPTLSIDAEVPLSEISWELQESLARLEPCGYANPAPLLYSPGVPVVSARRVGADGAHLKLVLGQGEHGTIEGIAFRMGNRASQLRERMDLVYRLEVNEWRGRSSLQLNVQDMRPAGER